MNLWKRPTTAMAVGLMVFCLPAAPARAANMYRLDLQSLAYMSTAVIEGDVMTDEYVHWVDKLTLKVTHVYAGDFKVGDSVVVGLSAYRKTSKDEVRGPRQFGAGDHLILFIEPVTQQAWKDDGIPYWPVASGLKLLADGNVSGVIQNSNPGPYQDTVDEGEASKYPGKVSEAVKWAAEFRRAFEQKKGDPSWLLEQLGARPTLTVKDWGQRDAVAATLCEALAATGDAQAISKARAMRTDHYERQLLDLPRPTTRQADTGRH